MHSGAYTQQMCITQQRAGHTWKVNSCRPTSARMTSTDGTLHIGTAPSQPLSLRGGRPVTGLVARKGDCEGRVGVVGVGGARSVGVLIRRLQSVYRRLQWAV